MLVRMWERGKPSTLVVGMEIGAVTEQNRMEFPQKSKNRTTLWPSISTPGYTSKRGENSNSKRYAHPSLHSSFVYNSQDMEATQVSTNWWIDKEDVVYKKIKKKRPIPQRNTTQPYQRNDIFQLEQHGQTRRALRLVK